MSKSDEFSVITHLVAEIVRYEASPMRNGRFSQNGKKGYTYWDFESQ